MNKLYGCLAPKMLKAYVKGGHKAAGSWGLFKQFSKQGYRSDTHGGRFVHNYVNKMGAKTYSKFDEVKAMPVGSVTAKPSFTVSIKGKASIGPLFIMEKKSKGWNEATADWQYAMIMPDGSTFGVTKGAGSAKVGFCHECHAGGEDNDFMLFLPEEYRK